MSPVATTPFPSATKPARAYAPGVVIALMMAVLVAVALVPVMGTARHVGVVTFDNPNAAEITVDVSSGRGDGWVGIGPIEDGEAEAVRDVFDAGETWILRFTGPGGAEEDVTVSRDDLEDADWTIQIPELSR